MKTWLARKVAAALQFCAPVLYFDGGVGEAAIAEGAKGAGEAAAAEGAGLDAAISGAEIGTASEGASLYGGSGALADAAGAGLTSELGLSGIGSDAALGTLGNSLTEAGLPQIGEGGMASGPAGIADGFTGDINKMVSDAIANAEAGGGGGGGAGDFLSKAGSSAMKSISDNPLLAAGLGMSAFTALNPPQVPDALKNISNMTGPAAEQAKSTLANNGAPTPDQKASIDRQVDDAARALLQKAANSGMGANSMVVQQQLAKLEEQRQTMYLQQAQQNIQTAMQELGIYTQGQQAVASAEMANSQAARSQAQGIAQSSAMLYALGNKKG